MHPKCWHEAEKRGVGEISVAQMSLRCHSESAIPEAKTGRRIRHYIGKIKYRLNPKPSSDMPLTSEKCYEMVVLAKIGIIQ